MLLPEIDYKETKQSEPTALIRFTENLQNNSRLGLTTVIALSIVTSAFATNFSIYEKDINYSRISRQSFTNLEITNDNSIDDNRKVYLNIFDEDYFDFAIKPLYTEEFKLKVKSFKIEKFVPSSF